MATSLQNRGFVSLKKGFLNYINQSFGSDLVRAVHASVYDKNLEESVLVPDEVIKAKSDKYWTPHPHTGVFGPATDHHIGIRAVTASVDSVLEQKAFFRPLEDLEKPAYV
ncbi:late embryogenesis abundant protein At5g17165 [Solanum lycopersicum]|uniref:Uncharacterized protein n=1 Tax=Solanum lycopersicum TaxID=4081 RepID=A0A3Q7H1W6_SOLLC|nr:late embryogenesis abundant protein At5g17165 [Solanum lycopersicum]